MNKKLCVKTKTTITFLLYRNKKKPIKNTCPHERESNTIFLYFEISIFYSIYMRLHPI